MKHNHILTASLIGGILLLAASCVKEKSNDDIYRPNGSEIIFAAETEYANGDGTRTEYSGAEINGTNVNGSTAKFERIDWVDGDDVKIYYKVGSAAATNGTYAIAGSSITAQGKDSKADVFHTSGTKLTWNTDTGNDHVFTAAYPASTTFDGTTMTGTIPASQPVKSVSASQQADGVARYLPQSMAYAYMLCKKTVSSSSTTNRVDLPFTPAMTAFQFQFKVASGMLPVTVTKFEMTVPNETGVNPLTGDFTVTINGENNFGATWNKTTSGTNPTTIGSNQGRKITVSFGSGVQMNSTNYLDFTVLALPVAISKATITFTFSDNTTKSLKLQHNSNWVTFDACKKYVITNMNVPGGESWDYYIDSISDLTTYGHTATTSSMPFAVTSYKVKRGTTTKVPVSWTIEYSANGTSGWTTSDDGKINVNTLSGGGGSTLTVNNGANVMRDHGDGEWTGDDPDVAGGATAILRSAPEIPSAAEDSDGYYDLSKHPVYGSNQFGSPQNMETANTYIIQRPGLYKFPLVYGNAIRNGATNTKSYAPSISSPQGHFLSGFVRHDGSAIEGPWITTDNSISVANAIIVWQDGTSNADGQIIKDAHVSVDGNYIKFEVKREYIRPGNVVIAARKSDGTIVWSWQIWVTEKDLSPKTIKADNGNVTLSMMPYNLGWMDATSASFTKYNNWSIYVRVSQTESGGTSRIFRIQQIGDNIRVEPNVGCNTFYQWGRKDPMLPATGDNADKAQYSAHNLAWESSKNHHLSSGGLEQSILHPNWQLVDLSGGGHVGTEAHYMGLNYGNLWDAELDNGLSLGSYYKRIPIKTVYDPCPPGFVVPYGWAFSGVSKNTSNPLNYAYLSSNQLYATYTATIGYHFTIPSSDAMDFPFCGARAHDGNHGGEGTSIYDVKTLGYYWTSCPLKYNSTANASGVMEQQAAKMMILVEDNYIRPGHEQRKGAAYAVRPVIQTEF